MNLNRNDVRKIALACGFTLRLQTEGSHDLNEYVYKFADAIAAYAILRRGEEKQKMTADDLFQGNVNSTNKTNQTANSHQVGGDHYKNLAIEPWDVVATWNYEQQVGFYRGNVLKYLLRAFSKGKPVEDLRKAAHYLQKLIEVVAKEQEAWDACKL